MFSFARGCRNASRRSYSAFRSQRECPMQCTTKEISFPVEREGGKKGYTLMKRTFFTKVYILIGFSVVIFKQHCKCLLTVAKLLLPLVIDESKTESNLKFHETIHSDCPMCSKTFCPTVLKLTVSEKHINNMNYNQ